MRRHRRREEQKSLPKYTKALRTTRTWKKALFESDAPSELERFAVPGASIEPWIVNSLLRMVMSVTIKRLVQPVLLRAFHL